jgi:flagellar motor switch protein FliN
MTVATTDASRPPRMDEFAAELGALKDDYDAVIGGQSPLATAQSEQALDPHNLTAVLQIPVAVKAVLGATTVPISMLMKMRRGTVLPLGRRVGEPIELTVNGRVIARGEVVVLEEGTPHLGISLTEVVGRYAPASDEQTYSRAPGAPR